MILPNLQISKIRPIFLSSLVRIFDRQNAEKSPSLWVFYTKIEAGRFFMDS